jgi:CO/xanthine dehydrogenase Mo-binding subunit
MQMIGKAIQRVDALDKVTGAAQYTADILLPGLLHAKVLRAGVAHARIKALDTSAAEVMPGVVKVITGRDCRLLFGTGLWDQPPLAVDKVRHAGEAVAVALARSPQAAEKALKKIDISYEPLPFVLDPLEAASPQAPLIHAKNGDYRHNHYLVHPVAGGNVFHHYALRRGDAPSALAASDLVVEESFTFPLSSHAALEPHAALCRWSADKRIEIWSSSQAPFVVRDVLSETFGLPASHVRVHVSYLGGGFGGKSDVTVEPLIAYAAGFVPGFAVKLVLSRREVFTSTLLGRGMRGRMKIGARSDGSFLALEAEMHFACGAYGDTSWPICTAAGHNCTGPYYFPAVKSDVYGVYTNSPPVGAYRGYGHPEGQFMMGRMMDILARRLKLPLPELMEKNFLREGLKNALGQSVKASHGDLPGCLAAVRKAVFGKPMPRSDGSYVYGRGLAAMMKSPKMASHASSGCHLTMSADGSVFINLSGVEMGQGCLTVFAQMAAEALSIPLEKVRVYREVDSQSSPWDWQTVASMQTYRGGRSIQQACQRAIQQLKENAALVLGCATGEVDYDGECCWARKVPHHRLPVASLARGFVYENGLTVGIPVETTGSFRVPDITEPDPETGKGNAAASWTFGCQAAEIRVERSSGRVEVLHFASAFDPGRVINPVTCRGQVTGGVVQGLGAALSEEIEFNNKGQIKNANFGPYTVPRMSDRPARFSVTFLETPNQEGPWSAKCIAEHPIVAVAPVIVNALREATGHEFTRLPVRPADILAALKKEL